MQHNTRPRPCPTTRPPRQKGRAGGLQPDAERALSPMTLRGRRLLGIRVKRHADIRHRPPLRRLREDRRSCSLRPSDRIGADDADV